MTARWRDREFWGGFYLGLQRCGYIVCFPVLLVTGKWKEWWPSGRSLTTLCRRYVTVVGARNVTDDPKRVTCKACLKALAADK